MLSVCGGNPLGGGFGVTRGGARPLSGGMSLLCGGSNRYGKGVVGDI
jgi:hypothetical protein